MKKLFSTIVLAIIATLTFAQNHVYVNGYYRSNGTYVQPHYRTAPNNTVRDNWSTYPNVNPYTGQTGTKHYNTYTPVNIPTPTPYYNSQPTNYYYRPTTTRTNTFYYR
jgi:hypothetical protein